MSRIFISYRRADSAGYAGRLQEHLIPVFGESNVFMDIDTIAPGEDFVQEIERAIHQCDVVLVLIGPYWTTIADARGQPRLDDRFDFVRLEIATALARADVRVIPVLVNGAQMPQIDDLPSDLQTLVRRNAIELSNERFHYDMDRLIKALGGDVPPPQPAAPRPAVKRGYNSRMWVFLLVMMAVYVFISSEYYRNHPEVTSVHGVDMPGLNVLGFNVLLALPALTLLLALFWPLDFLTGAAITFGAAFANIYYANDVAIRAGVSNFSMPLGFMGIVAALHAGMIGTALLIGQKVREFRRQR